MATYVPASSVTYTNETFKNNANIVSIDLKNTPFSTSLANSFYLCTNLTTVENINFDNQTSLYLTFGICRRLTTVPEIPNSITNMASAFFSCSNLVNTPNIPNSVTNLTYTFYSCRNLSTPPVIPDSVVDASFFIESCPQFFNESLYPNIPNSVQRLDGMYSTMALNETDVPQWCMDKWNNCSANVKTSMQSMFYSWHSLINAPTIPIGVKDLSHTFRYCNDLANVPEIPDSVTNMCSTFYGCFNLATNIYIYSENITDAANCFYNTTLTKNVYIPFTYENSVNTATYNAFKAAGYKTDGSKAGVYLIDFVFDRNRDGRYVDEAVDGSDDAGLVTDLTITDIYDAETITE